MENTEKEIQKAVAALGYEGFDLEIYPISYHRLNVFINGKWLGVYDSDKRTFVD